jgi:hypothetical protein
MDVEDGKDQKKEGSSDYMCNLFWDVLPVHETKKKEKERGVTESVCPPPQKKNPKTLLLGWPSDLQ